MYFAETIDQSQVTVTVKASHFFGAQRNQVQIISITHRSSSVTIDRYRVGKQLITTFRNITTGKE